MSVAPFETPVVPPVYCRNAMSCCVTATGSSLRRAPASSVSVNLHVPRQRILGHHLLQPAHREIDDRALGEPEHFAERRHDDVLDRRARDHLLQRRGEILEDHDRFGAGVLELVLELARRVQRIDVHDDVAGTQHAGQRDRVLHDVRHHDRDARALGQALRLQPGPEGRGVTVDFTEGEEPVHVRVRVARRVLAETVLDQVDERGVLREVDVVRDAGRIMLEPDSFHDCFPRSQQSTRPVKVWAARRSVRCRDRCSRPARGTSRRDGCAAPRPAGENVRCRCAGFRGSRARAAGTSAATRTLVIGTYCSAFS